MKQGALLRCLSCAASAMADPSSTSMVWPLHPHRTAAERRAQALRAQGRLVQKLLASFEALTSHRGCRASRWASALSAALRVPASEAPPSSPPCPSAASTQPAASATRAAPDVAPGLDATVLVTAGPQAGRHGVVIGLGHPDHHIRHVRCGNGDEYGIKLVRLSLVMRPPDG